MRTRAWWPVVLLGLAGCEGLTPPDRGIGYEYRHSTGIVFHWPADRLPVRYWIAPNSGDAARWITAGIVTWRGQLLYGEFDGILVSDSASADVIVVVEPGPPPDGIVNDLPPEPNACRGVTSFDVTPDFTQMTGALVIELRWDSRFATDDIVNCLYRVAIHEVGHTLGIFAHSSVTGDLMAPVPIVRDPTLNDRQTVERLYHTPPDVRPHTSEPVVP